MFETSQDGAFAVALSVHSYLIDGLTCPLYKIDPSSLYGPGLGLGDMAERL